MVLRALFALALLAAPASARQAPPPDPVATLVARLEEAGTAGDAAAILALGSTPQAPGLRAFATGLSPAPALFVVKERDRAALVTGGERLMLEIFAQFGTEAVISTWRVDLDRPAAAPDTRRIAEIQQLTIVNGLYRLALNPAKQFTVRDLTLQATDLTLELPSGQAFVAEIPEGPTAVVLLGRGRIRFAPADAAERTQLRIFDGEDVLNTEFDSVFIRIRPSEFSRSFAEASLIPRAVARNDFRRAVEVFEAQIGQTLRLDLTDLSRERWSLVPNPGDLIVEMRTRGLGHLTYARSTKDAEDISLFDRRRRRNIAIYASTQKLASRGRFYNEDELVDYDVLQYDVDASFVPDRFWIDGSAQLKVRIRALGLTAITLRLADPLTVRSVVSAEYGRLLHLRVVGQNSVIVNFPESVARGTELSLNVVYSGRLEPQLIDREVVSVGAQQPGQQIQEQVYVPMEPHFIYSNRSYWYPQAPVTDYATATLRLSVPPELDVVATGVADGPPVAAPAAPGPGQRPRKQFAFTAANPVRYLAAIISRFNEVGSRTVPTPSAPARDTTVPNELPGEADGAADRNPAGPRTAGEREGIALTVHANPRQAGRARPLADRAASILQYYAALMGDAPYPAFTLAVTENELPGGHSPAYFAMLDQPHPMSALVWRNDPVAFEGYGPYFLAHEIAHQWWGQAIGWKNYHEQWLSEGFAQYFAVLYAGADRGPDQQSSMFRQMRRWAMEESDQGPVYLGYRLGHIRGEGRVFRAVIYNKGAMVLHMLRRLVGDACFFEGLRGFYREWRFRKAGTDDLRLAMERACGQDLSAFFEGWIYGTGVPELEFTSAVSGSQAVVRFTHQGAVIPVPVTVSMNYTDGTTESIVVPVVDRMVERTVPLKGPVRSIEANGDYAALADIDR